MWIGVSQAPCDNRLVGDPKLIGYWLGPRDPEWRYVRDFVDWKWSEQERRAVAEWLRTGEETGWQPAGFFYLPILWCK
jgi:hypothetical protein